MRDVFTRIAFRIMPFLILLYVVAFLDRVNVGFAALTMNRDLHLADSAFGLGAGIFFIGYFLCEVPSNLMLKRFGARVWIARIMITWGALSIAMAFARGPLSYITLRALLGAAEAGFFPGIILYLSVWLPPSRRAGLISLFIVGIPLANVIGAPLSTTLLQHQWGTSLHSWQWLFILEGIPAILLGGLTLIVLTESPDDAEWLSREEKRIILRAQLAEAPVESTQPLSWRSLVSKRFLALTAIYFFLMMGLYGLGFWLPKLAQSQGMGLASIGWLSAASYGVGGAAAVGWSFHSDATAERKWHLLISFLAAALGQFGASYSHSKPLLIGAFAISAFGIFSAMPMFWAVVTKDFGGQLAAVAIALINSLGNLGGFAGPSLIGWLTERTGGFTAPLCSIGILLLAAGGIAMFFVGKVRPVVQERVMEC
ncbi:MAG: MFS transporter [Acidobacteriaceae bacterium]|nr:MFS transporter [Acidobacteriaceae bacterium]